MAPPWRDGFSQQPVTGRGPLHEAVLSGQPPPADLAREARGYKLFLSRKSATGYQGVYPERYGGR